MEGNTIGRRQFVATLGLGTVPIFGGRHAIPDIGHPCALAKAETKSWLEIQGKIYGARPDETGPTGGGSGYSRIVTKGDYTVEDLEGLLNALALAKEGQVIFIPSEKCIDLTTSIYIDQLVLDIPGGVTLASDRGVNGSNGATLMSDALKTPQMIRANGPNVRLTGLRLQGPNPKRHMEHHKKSFGPGGEGHSYYYRFPTSRGIVSEFSSLVIDNCEIFAFSRCAMSLTNGDGHHIHHNFIHQCQYNGLGYGVSHNAASSIIEHNLFEANRHSIAGTGVPGSGYIARHNVVLGTSLSHCFDMHGGRDRKDNTNVAGSSIEIYNNTFWPPEKAIGIRGEPEGYCKVYQNWFPKYQEAGEAIYGLSAKTVAYDNAFGEEPVSVK